MRFSIGVVCSSMVMEESEQKPSLLIDTSSRNHHFNEPFWYILTLESFFQFFFSAEKIVCSSSAQSKLTESILAWEFIFESIIPKKQQQKRSSRLYYRLECIFHDIQTVKNCPSNPWKQSKFDRSPKWSRTNVVETTMYLEFYCDNSIINRMEAINV